MFYHHLAALVGVLIGGRLSDAVVRRRRQFRLELQSTAMLLGRAGDLWMGLADESDGDVDRHGHGGSLPRAVRIEYARVAVRRHPPRTAPRRSADGDDRLPGRFRFSLAAGTVPRPVPEAPAGCPTVSPRFPVAYLIGGLAVLVAAKVTFFRDYCARKPPSCT